MKNRQAVHVEVLITELSEEGFGKGVVAYPSGKLTSIHIPFAIPGDRVSAVLYGKQKGIYQGRLEEILEPSPQRITPRCVHFGYCGGCRWQQISYERELEQKEQWITQQLAPYLNQEVKRYPILACHPSWHYRNKVELSFSSDKIGNQFFGFIIQGSKGKVFNLTECHLVPPWFITAVETVKEWWKESGLDAYHMGRDAGSLRTLTLRDGARTGDRLVMLTVSGNPDFALNKMQLNDFVFSLKKNHTPDNSEQRLSIFLRIQQIAKGRATQFYEMLLDGPDYIRETLYIQESESIAPISRSFKISPTAFFQPNTAQAERLYSRALQLAAIPAGSIVYDLYCGTGTLGICAARQAKEVIGVELTPESVLDARENIRQNGLANVTIIKGDVGEVLAQLCQQRASQPDVVMVDPPRAGLDQQAIKHILGLRAHTLIYISCNPVTQAANLNALLPGGYRIEAMQPVDQFPHTSHVENILILKRLT